MKTFFLVALMALIGISSFAATPVETVKIVKLRFIYPTQRQDGKPLTLSEIANCPIYITGTRKSTRAIINRVMPVLPPAATVNVALYPGNYMAAMSCIDKNGREGRLSVYVEFTL